MTDLGIVVIGRNEGERLVRCLRSVVASGVVVYVDSGSTDGSPAAAREAGAVVVDLDRSMPFTAARARNQGFHRLLEIIPNLQYVQFVDGDCEIAPEWLDRARRAMAERPEMAAVCGRLRERFPEGSVYNRLCDMEWNGPTGDVKSCGGIALYRVSDFIGVGGFDASVPAGEEPELCSRLRARGKVIVRLADEMGWHDAAMTQFAQWWRRAVRSGHAYAEGAAMHGRSIERHNVKEVRSIMAWGLAMPLMTLVLAWPTWGLSVVGLLAMYCVLWWRVRRHRLSRGDTTSDASLYATFCVIGKLAQARGACTYYIRRRLLRRPASLIEYKATPAE